MAIDIEAVAYFYWPGLIVTGIAFQEKPSTVPNFVKKYTLT